MKRESSPKITPEMASQVKFLGQVKKLYQHQVAALLGVNQGRISEIMRGRVFKDVQPAQRDLPF